MQPLATIVFTTHNRKEILRQAIQVAQRQTVAVKILVMDDASTDGTEVMIRDEFPDVEYHKSNQSVGPCYHRNKGIELAQTKIVFPIDDDSILQSPHTVEQTLAEFEHDQVGAVAIPYCNILQSSEIKTQAPDQQQIFLTHAYVAAAHAVRRDIFLKVGGYREFFFYMGEEGDFCIRLLQHRFLTRLGTADPIHHLQPPHRISVKADVLGRQNDVLFVICNLPTLSVFPSLIGTTLKGMMHGFKVKRPGNMIVGLKQGYWKAFVNIQKRSSVDFECFQLYRLLKHRQCVPLAEVQNYFR